MRAATAYADDEIPAAASGARSSTIETTGTAAATGMRRRYVDERSGRTSAAFGLKRQAAVGQRGASYDDSAMRRYHVTTFGCQMNAHDSERIKGMLEELGLGEARHAGEADVVVFNTCTIREKPDQRLAAHLAQAKARKQRDPDRVVAVGGCYAEAQRERIFELYPQVDVAFGPGTIAHLGEWLGAGGVGVARGRFGIADERDFAAELPAAQRAPLPGVGAGLDGLQLDLLVLHRPRGARPRAEPSPGRDPRRDRAASPRRASARSRCSART